MNRMLQIVATALLAVAIANAAHAAPVHVAGTIATASGDAIVVDPGDGKRENVQVDERTRISIRTPADHSILDRNAYVGVTATPQPDGSLLASEVHVFAEVAARHRRGPLPDERPAGGNDDDQRHRQDECRAPRPSMTNATVSGATKGAGARRLTLSYPDGTQTIVVPDDVPVVTSSNGDRSALVAGTHVIVNGERAAGGDVTAARISIGAHGSVPPI